MCLYKDADNTLQHMPYRKNGNHQEHIPWISAHLYDIKCGMFLGEMSRLATLSSKHEHYLAAMQGLVALYIRRGYPADKVHKWLYSNLSRRWNDCLADQHSAEGVDVLVLKTQYNLTWNYFNMHQLGDTIFGFWCEWLIQADIGNFNTEFPAPSEKDLRIAWWQLGQHGLWDLRETKIVESKVILSRKQTRKFLDISNLWKKSVLRKLEESSLDDIIQDAAAFTATKRPLPPDVNTLVTGMRPTKKAHGDQTGTATTTLFPVSDEVEHVAHLDSSPGPSSWQNAPMGSWGRGSHL